MRRLEVIYAYRDASGACSPAWPNGTAIGNLLTVYRPVSATPAGGSSTGPVTVTLSSPAAGVTIRFTLDGSTPTTTSPAYTAPLTISGSATLKVLGVDQAGNTSPVESYTFTIQ